MAKTNAHYDNLAITAIQQFAIGLEECDTDGSGTLDYAEFNKLLTNVQHVAAPDAKMRSWFNVCVREDEKEVSSFTWFIVSLLLANKAHGAPLVGATHTITNPHSRFAKACTPVQLTNGALSELLPSSRSGTFSIDRLNFDQTS